MNYRLEIVGTTETLNGTKIIISTLITSDTLKVTKSPNVLILKEIKGLLEELLEQSTQYENE